MRIKNPENHNISVAKGHGYTVEAVKYAMDFLAKTNRNTTLQEWVDAYNFIYKKEEKIGTCKPCGAAKYTASIRNFAKYGYLTLLNEGHTPSEFGIEEKKEKVEEKVENAENRIDLGKEESKEEIKQETVQEVTNEESKEQVTNEEIKEETKEETNEKVTNEKVEKKSKKK